VIDRAAVKSLEMLRKEILKNVWYFFCFIRLFFFSLHPDFE
jgi:hypothetical protein